MRLLSERHPDVGVLDVQLKDGDCDDVAKELVRRAPPFIVHLGRRSEECSPIFRLGFWVGKPSDTKMMVELVHAVLAQKIVKVD